MLDWRASFEELKTSFEADAAANADLRCAMVQTPGGDRDASYALAVAAKYDLHGRPILAHGRAARADPGNWTTDPIPAFWPIRKSSTNTATGIASSAAARAASSSRFTGKSSSTTTGGGKTCRARG